MKAKRYKINYQGKTIANVYFLTVLEKQFKKVINTDSVRQAFLSQLPKDKAKSLAQMHIWGNSFWEDLTSIVYGSIKRYQQYPVFKFDSERIIRSIKSALVLAKSNKHIFVPVFDIFVLPIFFKPTAVTAGCLNSEEIFLYINPKKNWQTGLSSALLHEYFHAAIKIIKLYKEHQLIKNRHLKFVRTKHSKILEKIIEEGLAEKFAELLTGYKDPSLHLLKRPEIKKYLTRLEDQLDSRSFKKYDNLGYGYPPAICHKIGYYLAGALVKKYSPLIFDSQILYDFSLESLFYLGRDCFLKELKSR